MNTIRRRRPSLASRRTSQGLLVARAAEGEGAGNARHGASAEREQEQVVGTLASTRDLNGFPVGVHRVNGPLGQLGAGFLGQPAHREALNLSEAEGRSHRERAVHELGVRRDELHRDPILGHRPQSERRLEPGDSSSSYEHVPRHGDVSDGCRCDAWRDPQEAGA